jgi:hypothetical protein
MLKQCYLTACKSHFADSGSGSGQEGPGLRHIRLQSAIDERPAYGAAAIAELLHTHC